MTSRSCYLTLRLFSLWITTYSINDYQLTMRRDNDRRLTAVSSCRPSISLLLVTNHTFRLTLCLGLLSFIFYHLGPRVSRWCYWLVSKSCRYDESGTSMGFGEVENKYGKCIRRLDLTAVISLSLSFPIVDLYFHIIFLLYKHTLRRS